MELAMSQQDTWKLNNPRGKNLTGNFPPIVCLGLEHAATIARDGFSKEDIKAFLFEHAGIPFRQISEGNRLLRKKHPDTYMDVGEDGILPIGTSKDDILIMVAGGEGKHSCWLPPGVDCLAVSRIIGE
ncbi:MAG: hypothetical protein HYX92_12885 [Chloroflexi bacterium]|nr:hypothetical protein [Chloroflexota bacterium]